MPHEVIVVGGGIGGLTVAALLAARGVDVCLFERQSQVGGCVAKFEHLGHTFDPTFGLYSGWEPGGTWHRIFSGLPITPPRVTKLEPNFVVRLPDGKDVAVSSELETLDKTINLAFPDCAHEATEFIRTARNTTPDVQLRQLPDTTSDNFRAFIDAQLAFLAQCTIDRIEESRPAASLRVALGEIWQIDGGPQSLADHLAASFTQSGGRLRLNSPVLRLAYGSDGMPTGVDLLSGERVTATLAIVSNLTVWDTYGKLVGLSRTPSLVSTALKQMTAWGVYQVFLLIDEATVARLPSHRLIFASNVQEPSAPVPHLMLTIANDAADSTKRTATLSAFTNVDEWFSFHEDSTWHEEQDQATLETVWSRLHAAAPEIGDGAEVIETATPQTYYDSTRRKMGLMGSPTPMLADSTTCFENLFMVGDTTASGTGLEGVAEAAELLVHHLTQSQKEY